METKTKSIKSYLALGDSYTIGELVPFQENWPSQLVKRLNESGIGIGRPKIIATTGWTTDELLKGISEARISEAYDLVSLLIGVNNQYRGYDIDVYKKEFSELLKLAISFAGGGADMVFVVSIPDYGVTSFVTENDLDPIKIKNEINSYNSEAEKICRIYGVTFFDITEWSRNAGQDSRLITSDGLHPSEKMYSNWVDICFDWVYRKFLTQ